MNILVLNCGSSSVKFALLEMPSGASLLKGSIDKISTEAAQFKTSENGKKEERNLGAIDQVGALRYLLNTYFKEERSDLKIEGIGHRVVHGGENFSASCKIDEVVLEGIRSCCDLAPLHNPANLLGVELSMECFKGLPQVAVFDTAFHQSLPPRVYRYALPDEWYKDLGVRRYGFHGSSHRYVSGRYTQISGKDPKNLQIVILHLGNGSSGAAIKNGLSVDTTMGMTPLEGLPMGTRSGDIDPGLFSYLQDAKGWSLNDIHQALNKKSGLLGLSGVSSDMQTLEANIENPQVALTIEVLCYRMARHVLGLCAALDRLDALVFTGGIGENSVRVRSLCVSHLKILGIQLNKEANLCHGRNSGGVISPKDAATTVAVVPTDEERMIAQDTYSLI